jgi:hypothetical protein
MVDHGQREYGNAALMAPGNPVLKNNSSGVASSLRVKYPFQF